MACLSLASPLFDSTNRPMTEEGPEASPAPDCFLSILAEASLERLHDAKRPRPTPVGLPGSLECGEALGGEGGERTTFISSLETAVRPRCPSRHSFDATSSRSTSPASSGSGGNKSYLCNRCGREYASTDAVRKHARQNHPDWLKEQGQGCPSLYCTAVEATGPTVAPTAAEAVKAAMAPGVVKGEFMGASTPPTVATAVPPPVAAAPVPTVVAVAPVPTRPVAAPVPALSVSAATGALPPAPFSPADPSAAHLLMNAAESCLALSMAAHADDADDDYDDDDDAYDYASRADRLAAFLRAPDRWTAPMAPIARGPARQSGGNKRPRSVRCGKCDGCERDDCGMCKNCVDKPKFGGIGQREQGCVRKICRQPRVAA